MPALAIVSLLLGLIQIQCTWTPQVETPISQNERIIVTLRTFPHFHASPRHPADLPAPLLEDLFSGLTYTDEAGILQELLNSPSSKSLPVFSPAQITFLAPQISLAFAQATPEEFVDFSCMPAEATESWIKGTMGIFDSQIFFLTLAISQSQQSAHPTRSSRKNLLQDRGTLTFTMPEAVLSPNRVQFLEDLQKYEYWIALDLKTFLSGRTRDDNTDNAADHPEKKPENLKEEDLRIQKLEEKMNRLLEKIEEQHNEIQRLQGNSP